MAFRLATLVALVVATLPVAHAAATPQVVARVPVLAPDVVTPPQPAGDAVVWGHTDASGWKVFRAGPGGARTLVASQAAVPWSGTDLQVLASATHVVVLEARYDTNCPGKGCGDLPRHLRLLVGPVAGPLVEEQACRARDFPPSIALDNALMAERGVCGAPGEVVVRDIADRSSEPQRFGATADAAVALAGDVLAVAEPLQVRVFDLRARSLAYAVEARPSERVLGSPFADEDGRVLFARSADQGASRSLWMASRQQPAPRLLSLRHTSRVFGFGRGHVLSEDRRRPRSLDVTPLTGGARPIARSATGAVVAGATLRGGVAAWSLRRCGELTVVRDDAVIDVPSPPVPAAPATRCGAPRLLSARIASSGDVVLRLLCRSGCRGHGAIASERSAVTPSHARLRLDYAPSARPRTLRARAHPEFSRFVRRAGTRAVRSQVRLELTDGLQALHLLRRFAGR